MIFEDVTSKKLAQLSKVIYNLNFRNEILSEELAWVREQQSLEIKNIIYKNEMIVREQKKKIEMLEERKENIHCYADGEVIQHAGVRTILETNTNELVLLQQKIRELENRNLQIQCECDSESKKMSLRHKAELNKQTIAHQKEIEILSERSEAKLSNNDDQLHNCERIHFEEKEKMTMKFQDHLSFYQQNLQMRIDLGSKLRISCEEQKHLNETLLQKTYALKREVREVKASKDAMQDTLTMESKTIEKMTLDLNRLKCYHDVLLKKLENKTINLNRNLAFTKTLEKALNSLKSSTRMLEVENALVNDRNSSLELKLRDMILSFEELKETKRDVTNKLENAEAKHKKLKNANLGLINEQDIIQKKMKVLDEFNKKMVKEKIDLTKTLGEAHADSKQELNHLKQKVSQQQQKLNVLTKVNEDIQKKQLRVSQTLNVKLMFLEDLAFQFEVARNKENMQLKTILRARQELKTYIDAFKLTKTRIFTLRNQVVKNINILRVECKATRIDHLKQAFERKRVSDFVRKMKESINMSLISLKSNLETTKALSDEKEHENRQLVLQLHNLEQTLKVEKQNSKKVRNLYNETKKIILRETDASKTNLVANMRFWLDAKVNELEIFRKVVLTIFLKSLLVLKNDTLRKFARINVCCRSSLQNSISLNHALHTYNAKALSEQKMKFEKLAKNEKHAMVIKFTNLIKENKTLEEQRVSSLQRDFQLNHEKQKKVLTASLEKSNRNQLDEVKKSAKIALEAKNVQVLKVENELATLQNELSLEQTEKIKLVIKQRSELNEIENKFNLQNQQIKKNLEQKIFKANETNRAALLMLKDEHHAREEEILHDLKEAEQTITKLEHKIASLKETFHEKYKNRESRNEDVQMIQVLKKKLRKAKKHMNFCFQEINRMKFEAEMMQKSKMMFGLEGKTDAKENRSKKYLQLKEKCFKEVLSNTNLHELPPLAGNEAQKHFKEVVKKVKPLQRTKKFSSVKTSARSLVDKFQTDSSFSARDS